MELSNLRLLKVLNTVIILEEAVDTDQVTAKLPVKVTRDRRHVPELPESALKADRCLYTEEFPRGASKTEIQKKLSALT